jgi:hypothetical protein
MLAHSRELLFGQKKAPAQVLQAWFGPEEPAAEENSDYAIHSSLRSLKQQGQSSIPAMPTWGADRAPAKAVVKEIPASIELKPASPYQAMDSILQMDSPSSQWLHNNGLLNKFISTDCTVDVTMTPDGTVNAALRSADGYRRTLLCRPDGSSAQRITGPNGAEIIRFDSHGQPVVALDKRENLLATA